MADDRSLIQFISGEELKALAEEERKAELARSVEGIMSDMDETYKNLGGLEFMRQWALNEPNEFFKLRAKLALSNKAKQHEHRIYIGLPKTSLDE